MYSIIYFLSSIPIHEIKFILLHQVIMILIQVLYNCNALFIKLYEAIPISDTRVTDILTNTIVK